MTAQDFLIREKQIFIDFVKSKPIKYFSFIGLDRSLTSTGLAVVQNGKYIYGREIKPKNIYSTTRLGYIVKEILNDIKRFENPIVFTEDYAYSAHGQGMIDLGELGGVTKLFLKIKKIPYVNVVSTVLKKYVVGKGNVKKEMVPMFVYKKFGITPQGHDVADAIGLAYFGYNCFNSINNRNKYTNIDKEVFDKFLLNEKKEKRKRKTARSLAIEVDDE